MDQINNPNVQQPVQGQPMQQQMPQQPQTMQSQQMPQQQPQQELPAATVEALKSANPAVAKMMYEKMGLPVPPEILAQVQQEQQNAPQAIGGAISAPQRMVEQQPMVAPQGQPAMPQQPPSGMTKVNDEAAPAMAAPPPPPPPPVVDKPMDPEPPQQPAPPVGGQVMPNAPTPQAQPVQDQAVHIQPDPNQQASSNPPVIDQQVSNHNPPASQPVQQTVQPSTPVGQALAPSDLGGMYEQDANDGMADMTSEDLAIPRLVILQALSPQVDANNGEHVQGATAGQFLMTPTNALLGNSIKVVPLAYNRSYIEWKPRDQGGGFVQNHGSNKSILNGCSRNEKNHDILANGNQIVTTAEYIVAILNDSGGYEIAAFSLSSTAMKRSRQWNTLISSLTVQTKDGKNINPPMYAGIYTINLAHEKNEKGSWYSPEFNFNQMIDQLANGAQLYADFKSRREALKNISLTYNENNSSGGGNDQNWEADSKV